MNILVVDDDQIVLESCKRILESEGFSVTLSPSAKDALKKLDTSEDPNRENLKLLLVDVKMPEYDGLYLMTKVLKKWPDLPIVVMSGYPTQDTISDVVKKGAAYFIAKPFTPDELLRAVNRVIKKEGL